MNLDYRFRADNSTHSTACTIGITCLGGKVTGFVGLPGDNDAILWAYYYTQATAFAPPGINYYFASHFCISYLLRSLSH
jgi:hypothetical protein